MNSISKEDYDAVVAGLMTVANIERKSSEEGELAIQSSLILTDQLLGDLSAAKQKLSDTEAEIERLVLVVDARDQELAGRDNEIVRLQDRLSAAERLETRRQRARRRKG